MSVTHETAPKTIELLQRATQANEQTVGRKGNLVVLTPEMATDVMVTADLHGHRENFNSILELADLEHNQGRHLILQEVCHGGPTYPDKCACMSHLMLEDIARLKLQYPDRVHYILSNHELAEMTDYPIVKGHRMLNLLFRSGLHEAYGEAADEVHESHAEFLRSLPLGVKLPHGILITHSAPPQFDAGNFDTSIFHRQLEDRDLQEYGPVFQLVWGRDYRPENAQAFAKEMDARILIHGHDPCPEGSKVPNQTQIILDCCSRPAKYLLIPTDRSLSHNDLVSAIQPLP